MSLHLALLSIYALGSFLSSLSVVVTCGSFAELPTVCSSAPVVSVSGRHNCRWPDQFQTACGVLSRCRTHMQLLAYRHLGCCPCPVQTHYKILDCMLKGKVHSMRKSLLTCNAKVAVGLSQWRSKKHVCIKLTNHEQMDDNNQSINDLFPIFLKIQDVADLMHRLINNRMLD